MKSKTEYESITTLATFEEHIIELQAKITIYEFF